MGEALELRDVTGRHDPKDPKGFGGGERPKGR